MTDMLSAGVTPKKPPCGGCCSASDMRSPVGCLFGLKKPEAALFPAVDDVYIAAFVISEDEE